MLSNKFGDRYIIFEVHVYIQHRAGSKSDVKEPCCAKFGLRIKGINHDHQEAY